MLPPGILLQNRYRVVRLIGRGGMGAVYEARHEELGHAVALKEAFHTEDHSLRRAFKREARMLAGLQHSFLPRVTDYFTEGDGLFLVMEYIAGDDLMELLKLRSQPFPVADVLRWADQLLDVLFYLHQQEPPVIHRDIKPNNIKLNARGDVVLLDFGLAKGSAGEVTSVVASRSVLGFTLTYAPLEQILKADPNVVEHLSVFGADRIENILQAPTDARSDLYALGATLYYLLTKRQPPQSPTRALAVWSGKPDPLPPARQLNPQVPPAVSDLLRRALELEADDRPASASEMRERLSEAARPPRPQVEEARAGQSETVKDSHGAPPPRPPGPPRPAPFVTPNASPQDSAEELTRASRTGRDEDNNRRRRRTAPRVIFVLLLVALLGGGGWLALAFFGREKKAEGEEVRRWLTLLNLTKNEPEAMRQITAALERAPRDPLALRVRSAIYYGRFEFDQGKRDAEEVVRLLDSPGSAEEYEARCYARFRLRKWDEAVSDCTRAIELDPRYKWAYNYRGTAYEQKGEHDRAIDDYDKALALDPQYVAAYNNRGGAYARKDKHDEALADYARAIKLDPQYPRVYYNRGQALYGKKKYSEAIADYSRAIEASPRYAAAHYGRGLAYHEKEDYDRALADYTKTLALDPEHAGAYYYRGMIHYHEKKEVAKAIADYDKAIELNPKFAAAYYQRGGVRLNKEEYDQAVADYDKAIEFAPQYADAYNDRGVAYVNKGEYRRAIDDFDKAIQIAPRQALAYRNRGAAYGALGESVRAEADRKKADELEKQKP